MLAFSAEKPQKLRMHTIVKYTFVFALLVLSACAAKPVQLMEPYKIGQYRITSALITVVDPQHVNDTAFNDRLKHDILVEIQGKTPGDTQLPEIGVTIIINTVSHSTSGGYNITSDVTLWENPSRRSIGTFPVNYSSRAQGPSTGANAGAGFGIAGAILGGVMGAGLDQIVDGDEDPSKTTHMLDIYSQNVANKLYPTTH